MSHAASAALPTSPPTLHDHNILMQARSVRFHPGKPGTPEVLWNQLLRHAPEWFPQNGPLLVVAPHPDDEILGAAGLMHAWREADREVTVVSVTGGEAADRSRADLSDVRRAELISALQILGGGFNIERLSIPDGRVSEHMARLRSDLRTLAISHSTILAPFEEDGHPDHNAVGEVCRSLAFDGTVARYPIWTWHHANPMSLIALRWRRFSMNARAWKAKVTAIQCFRSQLSPVYGPPVLPAHVVRYFTRDFEAFIL